MSSVRELLQYKNSSDYKTFNPITSDLSILSSKNVSILPRDGNTYGVQSENDVVSTSNLNRKIVFNLANNREFIDFKNSWFQANVKINASDNTGDDIKCFLDNGGIHSFIKNVVIRAGNKQELHRIENYNKLYNIYNLFGTSREYRDRVLGDSLDSFEDLFDEESFDYFPVDYDETTATYDSATRTISNMDGKATRELQSGDLLLIKTHNRVEVPAPPTVEFTALPDPYDAGDMKTELEAKIDPALEDIVDYVDSVVAHVQPTENLVRVLSVTDDNTIILADDLIVNIGGQVGATYDIDDNAGARQVDDVEAGGIKSIVRVSRRKESIRRECVSSSNDSTGLTEHKVCFQIPLGFMSMDELFPLPFMNYGIEIELELVESAHLGIVTPSRFTLADNDEARTLKQGILIFNPQFLAHMVEPSLDVMQEYETKYIQDGLIYHFMDYKNFKFLLLAGQKQYNFEYNNARLKSVQCVLSVMTNDYSNSSTVTVEGVRDYCQSNFLKNNMNSYRFQVGGKSFPQYDDRKVNVDSIGNGEAWKQLQLALGVMGIKCKTTSISNHQWRDRDSDKFIMAMLLAKQKYAFRTGINCMLNPIKQDILLNDVLANTGVLHSFVVYDKVITLSPAGFEMYY